MFIIITIIIINLMKSWFHALQRASQKQSLQSRHTKIK